MILLTSSALLHAKDSALGLLALVGWVGDFYKEKALSCVIWCLEVCL